MNLTLLYAIDLFLAFIVGLEIAYLMKKYADKKIDKEFMGA